MGEVAAEAVELPDDQNVALPQGAQAAVESRPVVAYTGGEVVVEVGRVVDGPHRPRPVRSVRRDPRAGRNPDPRAGLRRPPLQPLEPLPCISARIWSVPCVGRGQAPDVPVLRRLGRYPYGYVSAWWHTPSK